MKLSDNIERKFIEVLDVSEWDILTDTGWKPIKSSNKTIEYEIYELTTNTGRTIKCADTHILFAKDYQEIFAQDCLGIELLTQDGIETVVSVIATGEYDNMYDLSVNSYNHRYYTNGFLSHNSTIVAAYIAWYVQFNKAKKAGILANKASIAREIFTRVQFMIENLPFWMQSGVLEWNKTSFELDTKSGCFCAASSPSSIRGKSVNFLLCVAGETEVTLRNKLTGLIEKKQIKDITDVPVYTNDSIVLLEEHEWQVLTDSGWSYFSGIKVSDTDKFYNITFESGNTLKATQEHAVLTDDLQWVKVENLVVGNKLISFSNTETITSISIESGGLAYDLVGVKNNSRYYTNGILSHNCDEFAHLESQLADEFIASVFPTLSSFKESKLVLVSTPKGMNQFYKIWTDAENNRNGFVTVEGAWDEKPRQDQKKWYDEQLAVLGKVKFNQEVLCQFAGSSKTLVDGTKLSQIPFEDPIFIKDGLKIYTKPAPRRSYVMTVDTSRGQHLDHSAFIVYDITEMPYSVVVTFKDNSMSTMSYPYLIKKTCEEYNDAYCLIEANDAGGEVANNIFYELEYEYVYFTNKKDNLNEGYGYPGIMTSKKVKQVGCSVLKELIEQDQLEINSFDIIQELNIFSLKGYSYAAEDTTINDDLTTCLWLFAWLTKQNLFSELNNINVKQVLTEKNRAYIDDNMIPFGLVDNHDYDDSYSDGIPELNIARYGGRFGDPLQNWAYDDE